MYSVNSLKPRAARGQLWADIATEAGVREPFVLTPEVVHTVMAVLVFAGYRSAPSILSVAKQRHVQGGRAWTDALSLAQREANRAATRGLGPPRRTAPF
eukprot:6461297-Alexandrium_andersonii.AAC.1